MFKKSKILKFRPLVHVWDFVPRCSSLPSPPSLSTPNVHRVNSPWGISRKFYILWPVTVGYVLFLWWNSKEQLFKLIPIWNYMIGLNFFVIILLFLLYFLGNWQYFDIFSKVSKETLYECVNAVLAGAKVKIFYLDS